MSLGTYNEEYDMILFEGEIAMRLEEDTRTVEELGPDEQLALMQFQESSTSLQAYGHLCLELGLVPAATVEEVTSALARRDITLEEAADWLPACDYNLDCFRQTMFEELRRGARRVSDRRTKRLTIITAAGVVGTAIWWRWVR